MQHLSETGPVAPELANGAISVVILGNDAVAAAYPATGSQLSRACRAAGFDTVIGPTVGDEVLAGAYLEALGELSAPVVVACSCPLVADRLRRSAIAQSVPAVRLVAPPVAAARYARAREPGPLSITYVGQCPAGADAEIDARFTPREFMTWLAAKGIDVAAIDAEARNAPVEWDGGTRFASVPGGLPALRLVARPPVSRVVRALTREALEGGPLPTARSNVLCDASEVASCICSGARAPLGELEPPRALAPVVVTPHALSLEARPHGPDQLLLRAFDERRSESWAANGPMEPGDARVGSGGRALRGAGTSRIRSMPILAALAVLAGMTALGIVAYRLSAGDGSPERPATIRAAPRAGVVHADGAGDTAPAADARPAAGAAGRDSVARSPDTASAGLRARRGAAYRVVPGWLPQGADKWEPIDRSTRARTDTGMARPPIPPDTISRT